MSERTSSRGALGPLGAFVSDALETSYRTRERAHDVRIGRVVALLSVVMNVPFGIVDYVFQRQAPLFWLLVAARIVNVLVAGLVLARFGSLASARDRDRLILLWAGVLSLISVPIVLARPPGFGGPLAMGMVIIASFTLILPASFRTQLRAVALLVTGFVTARVLQGAAGATGLISTSGVLAFGSALCTYGSRRMHRSKRELFFALDEQHTLRGALEQALAEIRTLRGVVPICAFCHKIRDEVGDWHRVETYVSERTHAKFSHGFCPTCEETHYPENA